MKSEDLDQATLTLHSVVQSGTLGQVLKFYRKEAGLTQQALADLSDVNRTVIIDIENGKINIRLKTLLQVFKVLNISCLLKTPTQQMPLGG